MSKKYTFAILGGDKRQRIVAEHLISQGHEVRIYGVADCASGITGLEICFSLKKAIMGSNAVILPLPASRDGNNLNVDASLIKDKIGLHEIVDCCIQGECSLIFGGMLPEEVRNYAREKNIDYIDYYAEESLQKKNALPSAEGAIMLAMQNTDRVFEGMNILVCGYGRIGKLVAEKARRLGAEVTVAARRDEVICEIAMNGYCAIRIGDIDEMSRALDLSDVIFNTVPSIVINRCVLNRMNSAPLYIEIASSPGGIDLSAARDKGVRIVCAPSLPGRYAPRSAGEYIYETIRDLMDERGMEI